jgi:hypothetical protein
MVTSVVIIVLSLAMFVYWFRYSCILILESNWNEELAVAIAKQNELSFGSVEESLAAAESAEDFDRVMASLERDLRVVRTLLSNCPTVQEAGYSLECRMLMADYHLQKAWFALARVFAPPKARHALREMASIVGYMAGECDAPLVSVQS